MHVEVFLSAVDGKPVHYVQRLSKTDQIEGTRVDIVDPDEGLQMAVIRHKERGMKYRAHRHLERWREIARTQESWVVVAGKVKVMFHDIDGSKMGHAILRAGDCSISLRGGHGYEILGDDTVVYEFKLGSFAEEGDKVYL